MISSWVFFFYDIISCSLPSSTASSLPAVVPLDKRLELMGVSTRASFQLVSLERNERGDRRDPSFFRNLIFFQIGLVSALDLVEKCLFVFVRVLIVVGSHEAARRAPGGWELNEGECLAQLLNDVVVLCYVGKIRHGHGRGGDEVGVVRLCCWELRWEFFAANCGSVVLDSQCGMGKREIWFFCLQCQAFKWAMAIFAVGLINFVGCDSNMLGSVSALIIRYTMTWIKYGQSNGT